MKKIFVSLTILMVAFNSVNAADWPMKGGDAARSDYTDESLPSSLHLQWIHQSSHAPQPAWPSISVRMNFDLAYYPVIAGDTLYFGSSADGNLYALNTKTSEISWKFMTDGPIRFAPVVWKNRVYVASDDGHLYCLNAESGELIWKKRGGPAENMVLGNDRMVSKWPVRGGPMVKDGILYYAAGIWPSEGIYIYALDAENGETIWLNDSAGGMEWDQPHGGARAKSGVAAQGYLAASEDRLLIPTGRAVPASFNRKDGSFQYFHLQRYGQNGGAEIQAAGPCFYNRGVLYEMETGNLRNGLNSTAFASTPNGAVAANGVNITTYRWADHETADKRGNQVIHKDLEAINTLEHPINGISLIVAGNTIVSGGKDSVCVIDADTMKVTWSAKVEGVPYALAAANGRLYVSTSKGFIYCYGANQTKPKTIKPNINPSPYSDNTTYAQAAKAILDQTGINKGYCLDFGCGDGALAYELAKRSNLQIYAIDDDLEQVTKARKKLEAAGLYGVRVTVHHVDMAEIHYPDYFADLVVSRDAIDGNNHAMMSDEAKRLQRPYGGLMVSGTLDDLTIKKRGALAGAQSWTHQYSDPANTGCSDDSIVHGPLGMLWFRDADLTMPQRHGRGPAPLFHNGRLFVEGLNALRGINAYNGRTLWQYSLPGILEAYDQDHLMGTAGTNSNFCVNGDSVYVRVDNHCLRLDAGTGQKLDEYPTPILKNGEPQTWGYIACVDNTLFGSAANTEHIVKWRYLKGDMSEQFTESDAFFALDTETGDLKWKYIAEHSIRHNCIAIGDGKVFLIDRPIAEQDKIDFDQAKRRGEEVEQPSGILKAFNAETGDLIWGKDEMIDGTMIALSVEYDVLLMAYQATRFRLASESGGSMAAFRASTGERMWNIECNYASRPLINGQTVYAQPGAWDLLTGEQKDFSFSRSYGCGILSSSKRMLLFRSATLGYRDLQQDKETRNYGGIRPGCWINAIPAGGIVSVPDAASGCKCSYLNLASIALKPMQKQ